MKNKLLLWIACTISILKLQSSQDLSCMTNASLISPSDIIIQTLKTIKIIKLKHLVIKNIIDQNHAIPIVSSLLEYEDEIQRAQSELNQVIQSNKTNPNISKRKLNRATNLGRKIKSMQLNNQKSLELFFQTNPQQEAKLKEYFESRLAININEEVKDFIRKNFAQNQPLSLEKLNEFRVKYFEQNTF